MKCYLYHHLQQRIYLAEIKSEAAEALRLNKELSEHASSCAICSGLNAQPLEYFLFGKSVTVTK